MGHKARAAGAALAVAAIGLTAALAGAAVGGAASGEAPIKFDFGVSRQPSPATGPGATNLELGFEVTDVSNGAYPYLTRAKVGLDRSIKLEPGDLPTCRRPTGESRNPGQVPRSAAPPGSWCRFDR